MIVQVDSGRLYEAAVVHSVAWKESHRAFCGSEFIEKHTPERQLEYLRGKLERGSSVYMLYAGEAAGIVSVAGNIIEDLYVLPGLQRRGYGTELLRFAIACCSGTPTLWILENNSGAEELYLKNGFRRTGRRIAHAGGIDEVGLSLMHNPSVRLLRPVPRGVPWE